MADPRCQACKGSAKCPECFGSGTNIHLNETEPKCRQRSGTGTCPACKGTGISPHLWETNWPTIAPGTAGKRRLLIQARAKSFRKRWLQLDFHAFGRGAHLG